MRLSLFDDSFSRRACNEKVYSSTTVQCAAVSSWPKKFTVFHQFCSLGTSVCCQCNFAAIRRNCYLTTVCNRAVFLADFSSFFYLDKWLLILIQKRLSLVKSWKFRVKKGLRTYAFYLHCLFKLLKIKLYTNEITLLLLAPGQMMPRYSADSTTAAYRSAT